MNVDIKQRLLIIHNDGALLYGWHKSGLVEIDSFDQNPTAMDRFYDQLLRAAGTPFVIIVDCIEEDFRHENVVHVTGSDRKALLDRKLTFLFRTTPYRLARIIGREKDGRKDDKALFSALSRTELLDPWIKPILDHQIAIKSVSSAAFLMETFAHQQHLHTLQHLLLVNVEPQTGVRQTYLQKGKVLFSRLSPRSQAQHASIEDLVKEQAIQTRKYLERIKLLPYDTEVETVVYIPQDCTELDSEDNINHMRYQFCDTRMAVQQQKALSPDIESPGAVLLTLGQGLRQLKLKNVYGPFQVRRYFFISQVRTALFAAGIAIFIGGAVTAAPTLMDAMQRSEETENVQALTAPILLEYEQLRERFPETPIASNTMALIVNSYDTIASQIHNPGALMVDISKALSTSPNLRITNLVWNNQQIGEAAEPDFVVDGALAQRTAYMRTLLAKTTTLSAVIQGSVNATSSIRTARDQVQGFIDALNSTPNITVTPITMPVNLESDATVSMNLNGMPVAARFELALEMQQSTGDTTSLEQQGLQP